MAILLRKGILLLSLFYFFNASAQENLPVYTFLKDDSLARMKLYEQSQQKKTQLLGMVDKSQSDEYKKLYNEIFTEIGALWKSTRVVTDAKANDYLQSVAQKITDANPVLKELDVRIIFTRDWWPNAACMTDGTIVFNAGLMIYLANEAELAFVLSHEMAHYYMQHNAKSIKKYIETVSSKEFQAELKRLSKKEYGANQELEALAKTTAFNSRRHSRDNESEADRYAFNFLKKSGYDCNAITSCLQLLDKIDDSLKTATGKFQETFSFSDYPFKKKWIQEETAIFSQMDHKNADGLTKKEQDSLKTHPDCIRRIADLKDSVSAVSPGKSFMVSQEIFTLFKNDFFAEITEECYRDELLSRNLYYSLLLMQDANKKTLGIYSVARCLNEIYDAQKAHKLGSKLELEDKKYSGDYNLFLRMLSRIRLEELANLNYYFCNTYQSLMKNYPGFDKEILKAGIAKNNYQ
jgi:hypothetical protein